MNNKIIVFIRGNDVPSVLYDYYTYGQKIFTIEKGNMDLFKNTFIDKLNWLTKHYWTDIECKFLTMEGNVIFATDYERPFNNGEIVESAIKAFENIENLKEIDDED